MEQIFKLMINLEESLSNLYKNIKKLAKFKNDEIVDVMINQCQTHSSLINDRMNILINGTPVFDKKSMIKLQTYIQEALYKKIVNETDEFKTVFAIAETEHTTGRLYQSIASYFQKLATHYQKIAEEVNQIADEEFMHEKMLWNDYDSKHPENVKNRIDVIPPDLPEF